VKSFEQQENELRRTLMQMPIVNRGEWQAKVGVPEGMRTPEMTHVQLKFKLPELPHELIEMVDPNLPWAEDHFQERVSGEPLNPPPSHTEWPYGQSKNEGHMVEGKFSHTYPERFWPVWAEAETFVTGTKIANSGIRFEYGDLNDLVELLIRNPYTRQAYLPVWFPEDLRAARERQRVPCTLGYHFLATERKLDITYNIRSCDFMRHFRDDVYMAGRLCQWVVSKMNYYLEGGDEAWEPGILVMNIGSLHCFEGDLPKMRLDIKAADQKVATRFMSGL
jgi:hypothetical protein